MLSSKITIEVGVDSQALIEELIDVERFYGSDIIERHGDNYVLNLTLRGVGSRFSFKIPIYVQVVGNRVYHIGFGGTEYLASFEVVAIPGGSLLIAWVQLRAGRKAWFMGANLDEFLRGLVNAAATRAILKRRAKST